MKYKDDEEKRDGDYIRSLGVSSVGAEWWGAPSGDA
jgi:hypothetical protein